MSSLRCDACGIEIEAGCKCGAKYSPVRMKVEKAEAEHPGLSLRALAPIAGVSYGSVHNVREEIRAEQEATVNHQLTVEGNDEPKPSAPVEPEMRIGRDGVKRPARMSIGDKVRAYNEATGFKILGVKIKRAKPLGRMPDDTREKIEGHIKEMKARISKLEKLAEYSEQMSNDLRHLLADEMKEIKAKSSRLAKDFLGGDRDLRKVKRPLCNVEIPLRKEEVEEEVKENHNVE